MPYTPPAQLSPAASKVTTPIPSRSSSYIHTGNNGFMSQELTSPVDRPHLPRSTGSSSYLSKQRRSPTTSVPNHDRFGPMTDSQRGITLDPHSSMRQSPPPVTNGLIPSGMTISPPDSSQNSDDEEVRGRTRELDNLEELQAAISQIQVRRSSSPNRDEKARGSKHINGEKDIHSTEGTSSETRPPLSKEARKISHSRSNTDSNIVFSPDVPAHVRISPASPYEGQETSASDSDDCDEHASRPPMLRKKSGELVRPALRPASRRRPSSMPGTPTYSKAVHFDSHLEHVRHFLQVDKPLAVSAGSSPVEAYESENEFPFGSDEAATRSRAPVYEWEIRLANFPADTPERKDLPVHVERVFLSADQKNLIGTVAVQNLAFQKFVVARFTLDYWKTTSEVIADFNNDVRRKHQHHDELDRFNFTIRLADQANLESKTLFFCVKYNVNGQDLWDSNNGYNYQVDFSKKMKTPVRQAQQSGLGAGPAGALPRSRPSPPTSSGRSSNVQHLPPAFDDFASNFDNFGAPFGQSPSVLIGEPKIKLRSPRSKSDLIPDAPMRRNKSTPMFGHRYDFNSSLTAAKNSAYAILGDQSGLSSRTDTKQSSREVPAVAASKSVSMAPQKHENSVRKAVAEQAPKLAFANAPMTSKPASALVSEKPSLTSQSYQELVDKYCFFGSATHTPPLTRSALGRVDGSHDARSSSGFTIGSATSSGSSSPTVLGSHSPSTDLSSITSFSAQSTRSSSPIPRTGSCLSSRSASPVQYNYFYPHAAGQNLGTPTATAIQG